MVWSVFSWKGTGNLHIVEGSMNQGQYAKILQDRLLPQMREWFNGDDCVFMHDGAPCHKAKSVGKFLDDHGVSVLPWPGNSPDMNPIENLWAIVKKKIRMQKVTTKDALIELLNQTWLHDPDIQNSCRKLVESMPNRVKLLIKAKGMQTRY